MSKSTLEGKGAISLNCKGHRLAVCGGNQNPRREETLGLEFMLVSTCKHEMLKTMLTPQILALGNKEMAINSFQSSCLDFFFFFLKLFVY